MLRQVLEDAGNEIQQLIRNERNEYKLEAEKRKLDLIDKVNMKVQEIEDKRNVSLETLKACLDALEAKAQELSDMGEQKKRMLEDVANEGVKNVNVEAENALNKIQKAEQGKNMVKIVCK